MYIDFAQLTAAQRYFAMVQTIIPRPIAWVLSDSGDNGYNLAPYSFFTGVCSSPPLLMLSAGKKPSGDEEGREKDTRLNIRERKHFVVHIADTSLLQPLNDSAETLNHGVSELEKLALPTVPFDDFALPRIEDCHVAMACTLYRMDEIGDTPQAIIYGEIKKLYVSDEAATIDETSRLTIDPDVVDPLCRLGGSWYSELGDLLRADRPK